MAKRKKKNEGGIWGSVTDKDWSDTFQDEKKPRKKKAPKKPKKGRRKKDDNWGW